MGKINLIRVDERLIHGQVMVKWSKGRGTNAIYVVDDETAEDDFMKEIYISTNTTADIKIKVYSIDEAVEVWEKNKFDNDNVLLLFKNVKSLEEAYNKKLEIKEVNIGVVSKKGNAEFIISSVALQKEEKEILKNLYDKGVSIYFQSVPESEKVMLENILK